MILSDILQFIKFFPVVIFLYHEAKTIKIWITSQPDISDPLFFSSIHLLIYFVLAMV